MSFDAFSSDPNPPRDSSRRDAVIAAGNRRLSRRRGIVAAAAVAAAVLAAAPLALRTSDNTVSTDRRPTANIPPVAETTTTTQAPLPTPDVVYGTGPVWDCDATVLVPSFLPDGFAPIRDPQEMTADWQTAYGNAASRIYVYGDFAGDRGDDASITKTNVRGHTATATPEAIEWTETSPCASVYVVTAIGVDESTMVKVAQSLQDNRRPARDLGAETAAAREQYVGRSFEFGAQQGPMQAYLDFSPKGSGSVWLVESYVTYPTAGDPLEYVNEVHDGTRRMLFYADSQTFGGGVPATIWDVIVVDFNIQYACTRDGGDPEQTIFGKLAPGEGRMRTLSAAWTVDEKTRKIVETSPRYVTCDTESETGNFPGPYAEVD